MVDMSLLITKAIKSIEASTSAGDQQASLQEIIDNVEYMECLLNLAENEVAEEACYFLLQNLLLLYQSGTNEAGVFVLHFIPAIIWIRLSDLQSQNKAAVIADAILLSIYNRTVGEHTDTPFAKSYRMPSLSKPSIYHEPVGIMSPMSALTEGALSRHEQAETPILIQGPKKQLDRIPAQYRAQVIGAVLNCYNNNITYLAESAHKSFCVMAIRLGRSGYPMRKTCYSLKDILSLSNENLGKLTHCQRVRLESNIIEPLITGIHFIMFNGSIPVARQAIDDLLAYASFSLSSVAIMLTQALAKLCEMPFDQPQSVLDGLPSVVNPLVLQRRKRDPLPNTRGRLTSITRRRNEDDKQTTTVPSVKAAKDQSPSGFYIAIEKDSTNSVPNKKTIVNGHNEEQNTSGEAREVKSIVFNHSYAPHLKRVKSFERKRTVIRAASAMELRSKSLIANETTIKVQLENANPIIIQSRSVCSQSAVTLTPAAETEL